MAPAGPSQRIAEHFARLDFADLSAGTVDATRRALLDAYGVMLAASGMAPEARPFAARALADGGRAEARLIGEGGKVPASAAAFANGALGHTLDFGDTFDAGPAHPNAALVPALLALADADPAIDGGRFIAAMAAGSDLACRISLAPAHPLEERGWYPPPFAGMIGAAAACAALLGLDAEGIVAAIGLSLCQASFPGEIKFDPATQLRGLREAFAARSAVSSALLARDGVRGFSAPLEGKAGFFALYGGGFRADVLLDGLGQDFLGDRVSFKPWPCCRGTHAYIEAALAIREQVDWRTIEKIEAETGPIQKMLIAPLAAKAAPSSAIDAKFSIPFTAAMALVRGAVTLDSFSPAALADEEVLEVARKVVARPRADWGRAEAASGALTVTTATRQSIRQEVMQAAGNPDRPLTERALVDKFAMCAARARLPRADGDAHRVADAILGLGPGESVAELLN